MLFLFYNDGFQNTVWVIILFFLWKVKSPIWDFFENAVPKAAFCIAINAGL